MKRFLKSLALAAALLTTTAAFPGRAQEHGGADGCPDEQATALAGHSVKVGPIYQCLGLYYFRGAQLTVEGPSCPSGRLRYPDRNVCAGEPLEGAFCEEIGELPVWRDTCKCAFLELFDITLPLLICRCEPLGIVGHVSDAATFACPEDRE